MTVLAATRRELKALGVLDTVEGQGALVLARNLDGGRNGMAKSPDLRTLQEVMDRFRNAKAAETDTVDHVRNSRQTTLRLAASAG